MKVIVKIQETNTEFAVIMILTTVWNGLIGKQMDPIAGMSVPIKASINVLELPGKPAAIMIQIPVQNGLPYKTVILNAILAEMELVILNAEKPNPIVLKIVEVLLLPAGTNVPMTEKESVLTLLIIELAATMIQTIVQNGRLLKVVEQAKPAKMANAQPFL